MIYRLDGCWSDDGLARFYTIRDRLREALERVAAWDACEAREVGNNRRA